MMRTHARKDRDNGARAAQTAGRGSSILAALLAAPFRTALFGTLALFAAGVTIFTPMYETNDDVLMNLIAAGSVVADAPDEHLLFSNVLIGLVLKQLYSRVPSVPWYGWYQIAGVYFASVSATFAILRVNRTRKQLVLAVAFLGAIALPCLLYLQFTKTAFLLSLSGVLLATSVVLEPPADRRRELLAAAILLVAGSLVRFESFALCCLASSPLVVYGLWSAEERGVRRRHAIFLVAVALAAVGLDRLNWLYYGVDREWGHFYSFNALRAEFVDYHRVSYNPATKPAFDAVEWGPIDLTMLEMWFFADRRRYSEEKLQTVLSRAGSTWAGPAEWNPWEQVRKALTNVEFLVLLFLPPCCWAMGASRPRARTATSVAAVLACTLSGLFLHCFHHLPHRVYIPLFWTAAAMSCLLSAGGWAHSKARGTAGGARAIALAGGAAVLLFVLIAALLRGRLNIHHHLSLACAESRRMIEDMAPRDDQLYVLWREQFPYEAVVRPLDDLGFLRTFKAVGLSSILLTPLTDRRLREFGIDDLYRALYERDDVFLVSTPYLNECFQSYVAAHYDVNVTFTPIHSYRGRYVRADIFQARVSARSVGP